MQNITWEEQIVDVGLLKGYKNNPRDITDVNLELLKQSVETYGQVVPLVVNQDFTVLGGNQRIQVMQGNVKVIVPSRMLTAQEEAELVIILNNKLGEWDFTKMDALGFDKEALIEEFGFDEEFLTKNEINLDDFSFDEDAQEEDVLEDKLVKQFVVKFENITAEQVTEEIEAAFVKENVQSLEDLILKKVIKYESNNN